MKNGVIFGGVLVFVLLFYFLFIIPKSIHTPIKIKPNQIYELKTNDIIVIQIIEQFSDKTYLVKTQIWQGEDLKLLEEDFVQQNEIPKIKDGQFEKAYKKYLELKQDKSKDL